jgi:2-C-methyl-D-erythritol 4-phosphate cytidylyltransferase
MAVDINSHFICLPAFSSDRDDALTVNDSRNGSSAWGRRDDMSIAALILAAGQGQRMGLGYNKMFLELLDKPLLAHTLKVWQPLDEVEQLVVVTGAKEVNRVKELVDRYRFSRVTHVVAGGNTRQESVYQGLLSLVEHQPDIVLIHDGARPFVNRQLIKDLINAVRQYGAAILAVPVKDTIKVAEEGQIKSTLDRSRLWAAQTPQGFRFPLIIKAHQEAIRMNRTGTDDAALVEALGHLVYIVHGSAGNIKVTTPDDIRLALAMLKRGESV